MSFKRILAVGAHPDDVELGCSGTLLRMMQEGAEIDIVICRDDNAPKPSVWRDRETMQKEYQKAESLFGLKFNILKNPITEDGRPVFEHNSTTVKMLDDIVQSAKYDLVITHSSGDHHQDHQNTFSVVNSALRRYQGEFWLMEGGPYSNKNQQFKPNVFVDITEQIDKKIELVSCYDSYFSDTLLHNIKGLAAYRGQMLNAKYAEAFECKWRTI
jgi:LmbE family N-acetylglucosaminyl deacetylase|tara:strand:+ start:419 stop:1060 length:642 start_codon:yes stop_codon:yes gene_type:complete